MIKQEVKNSFSHMPYGLQRFFAFPYAVVVGRKSYKIDKQLSTKLSIDESLDRSFSKFKRLMNYAYEHVPYYRDTWSSIGVNPKDINSYDDIDKLPIIDKQIVIEHYDQFISDDTDQNVLVKHSTGGSSGITLTLLYDNNTVLARRLGILRWMNFAGINRNEKGVWIGRMPQNKINELKLAGGYRRLLRLL